MNNVPFTTGESTLETFEIPQPAAMPYVFWIVNIGAPIQINQGVKNA